MATSHEKSLCEAKAFTVVVQSAMWEQPLEGWRVISKQSNGPLLGVSLVWLYAPKHNSNCVREMIRWATHTLFANIYMVNGNDFRLSDLIDYVFYWPTD